MLGFLNPLPNLSKYNGPYNVGSTEFEIPVSEIASSVPSPDLRVTTIKFRLYYPTDSSATSKKSIPWLPTPQKQWNQAYAQFMGISERRAGWLSSLPSLLNYATIPAVQNAQLLKSAGGKQYPVVIFSHGLGGNYNAYSSLVGSLASCGVVCIAPEHRDGSAPTSIIKSSREQVESIIPYVHVSHSPTTEVLNARNAMLRTRLFELDLVYSTISQMNQGKRFTNFADTVSETDSGPILQNTLDLKSSNVTWAGHSFGSATMVQLVKSVYYHKEAPEPGQKPTDGEDWDMTPIFTPNSRSDLVKQITPESPIALCDLWTMPLRGAGTRWLWERPLPCYSREVNSTSPNVVSIMSAEFYKWPELRNRTCAVLSKDPEQMLAQFEASASASNNHNQQSSQPLSTAEKIASQLPTSKKPTSSPAEDHLKEPVEPDLTTISSNPETQPHQSLESSPSTRETSPAPQSTSTSSNSPLPTPHSSTSSLPTHTSKPSTSASTSSPVHLYLVPNSAHLSQSDFGPLFPNLTRYLMKALDPEKTMELNVRAIAAMMRGRGLDVKELKTVQVSETERDGILNGAVVERFERLSLNL